MILTGVLSTTSHKIGSSPYCRYMLQVPIKHCRDSFLRQTRALTNSQHELRTPPSRFNIRPRESIDLVPSSLLSSTFLTMVAYYDKVRNPTALRNRGQSDLSLTEFLQGEKRSAVSE